MNKLATFAAALLMVSMSAPGLAWETTLSVDPAIETDCLFPHQLDDGFTVVPLRDPLAPMTEIGPINVPAGEPAPAKKGIFEKIASRCEKWAEDHPVAWRRTKNIACGFLFLVNLSGAVGNTIRWSW